MPHSPIKSRTIVPRRAFAAAALVSILTGVGFAVIHRIPAGFYPLTLSSFSDWTPVEPAAVPPNLALTKTGSQSTVTEGNNLKYTLTTKNNGGDATNVMVTDTLPANVDFVSASTGCSNSSGTVTCTNGSLAG